MQKIIKNLSFLTHLKETLNSIITGIKESVCEVIGSQYLTKNGWNELRNPSDTSVPFRLFRDEDSTFLQVSVN